MVVRIAFKGNAGLSGAFLWQKPGKYPTKQMLSILGHYRGISLSEERSLDFVCDLLKVNCVN